MPIYEYQCSDCDQRVSILRGMDEKRHPVCPVCGSEHLTRLASRVSVVQSGAERLRDLSWIDRNLADRLGRTGRKWKT